MSQLAKIAAILFLTTGPLHAQTPIVAEAAKGIDWGVKLGNTSIGAAVAGRELYDDWSALDSAESDCGSAYMNAGPMVPSGCAESAVCRQCYESAVESIDFNRFYVERAYCVTAAALKMAKSATAFGDSASGIHGVMGLSWQLRGKPQIKEATESLKKTYKSKAGQYLNGLDRALKKLGQCEAEHFGEQDWYARYGWIYLSFMKARYEPVPSIPN